ncbi:MAG TPA: FtsX-like permease family protein [Candidatus Saccharimonadales bacterium]|nr:FtsX-like permease family protein [Candidatus Saccharimonadales bacterium]
MTGVVKHLLRAWTWRMCWRDCRTNRGRLLLFSLSIVLGVAALAAIGSLGANLERAVEEQAKTLLGADLAISSRRPFSAEEERLFVQLGGRQARQISFNSMVYFSSTDGTRLAEVRALSGGFPFYGQFETAPQSAVQDFQRGAGALVEENLLIQFDAKVGGTVRIGRLTAPISGALRKVPGESAALALISPRVYLPMNDLPATGLGGKGTLARYTVFFEFPPSTDVETLVKSIQPQLDQFRLSTETVEKRKQELGRAMENLYHFLNLAGLTALLLGGIGVAGAVHTHVRQKLPTAAVLRCLGCSVSQTFAIYLAQGIALGVTGAFLGALLGALIQSLLPRALASFIPFDFQFRIAWLAVGRAGAIGFCICLLFALLPLLSIRRVSPLAALRLAWEPDAARRDPLRWMVGGLLLTALFGFGLGQERNWRMALGFSGGLAFVFASLAGTAAILMRLLRKWIQPSLPFVLRQGLAGLHRPNNRTQLLVLSLGLGTFLITSIALLEHMLAGDLLISGGPDHANAILFDIQRDQRLGVSNLVAGLQLPVLDQLPLVNMRIASIKGRDVESLLADKESHRASWPLRREYRSTYTDHLRDAEKVTAGRWIGRATNGGAVPISIEEGIAGDLRVGLGDEIVFDVQGIPVTTRIASLREVNWRRMEPNFFMLFPLGALENAPGTDVLVTRVASSAQSAQLQRAMVKAFPNVSVIDLTMIVETLDAIVEKVFFVIRFMALFTVLTGILVLVSALVTGHFQRVRESVLLRTLGASGGQVYGILLVEYVGLGVVAALTGVILALGGAWALAQFVFHIRFAPEAAPVVLALMIVPLLTGGIGLLMSRGILKRPPLELLRAETG